jgi:hypothetical protein
MADPGEQEAIRGVDDCGCVSASTWRDGERFDD